MQLVVRAVGQLYLAMHNIGVSPADRPVKRPLKFAVCKRQPAQRHIALRPRIAQALGLARQVRRHFGQQVGLIEVKAVRELEPKRLARALAALQPKLKNGSGTVV